MRPSHPRTRIRQAARLIVGLGAASLLVAFPAVAAQAATPSATPTASPTADATLSSLEGLKYVALGDSYAAGYGLGDLTDKPNAACGQSADDYPHQIAKALGLDLTDVSCAGATTANIVDTKQGGAAVQSSALGRSTRLVTVSIGGNDGGLFASGQTCLALSATGPVLSSAATKNCKATFVKNGTDTLAKAITDTVAPDLARAFATIKKKAPNAQVFVVGYPVIFPDAADTPAKGCFRPVFDGQSLLGDFPVNGFPFTNTDVVYLHGIQSQLDQALQKATAKAGFHFVDTQPGSEAHSACSTSAPYVNGVTLSSTDGLKKVNLVLGALHPNSAGASYLAVQAGTAVYDTFATLPPTATAPVAEANGDTVLWVVGAAALVVALGAVFSFRAVRRARSRNR